MDDTEHLLLTDLAQKINKEVWQIIRAEIDKEDRFHFAINVYILLIINLICIASEDESWNEITALLDKIETMIRKNVGMIYKEVVAPKKVNGKDSKSIH